MGWPDPTLALEEVPAVEWDAEGVPEESKET